MFPRPSPPREPGWRHPSTCPSIQLRRRHEIGWILHASPKDLLVSRLAVEQRSDGRLAARIRVIQTQPQACKAKLRFLRNVDTAILVDGTSDTHLNRTVEELESIGEQQPSDLKHEGDMLTLSLASHGVADCLVVFARTA